MGLYVKGKFANETCLMLILYNKYDYLKIPRAKLYANMLRCRQAVPRPLHSPFSLVSMSFVTHPWACSLNSKVSQLLKKLG